MEFLFYHVNVILEYFILPEKDVTYQIEYEPDNLPHYPQGYASKHYSNNEKHEETKN